MRISLLLKNMRKNTFKPRRTQDRSDKGFKGIVVNQHWHLSVWRASWNNVYSPFNQKESLCRFSFSWVRNKLRQNKARGSRSVSDYELEETFLSFSVNLLRQTLTRELETCNVTQLVPLDTTQVCWILCFSNNFVSIKILF